MSRLLAECPLSYASRHETDKRIKPEVKVKRNKERTMAPLIP